MRLVQSTFAATLCLSLMFGSALAQTAFDDPMAGGASTGGSLVAVEPAVDGGTLALGSNTQVIIRFRNDAAQAVTFGSMNLYPTSNITTTVAMNQCAAAPLQFGSECAVVLAIKALKAGPFRTEMLIQHSGRSKLITAAVSGTVDAADRSKDGDQILGDLQATPDILDFGTLLASRPALRTIQIRNISEDTLTISSVSLDSPQKSSFTVTNTCKELATGESCIISVEWSPRLAGPSNGILVINHSGTAKVTTLPVQGSYQPAAVSQVTQYPEPLPGKGLLVASADEIDFGGTVDSEAAKTITLVNSGDADLKLNALTLSVAVPGLIVDPTGCSNGTVLKPTEACPLTMRWAPQRKGSLMTDLRIAHDGTRGVLVIPIMGGATEAVTSGGIGYNNIGLAPSPSAPPSDAQNTSLPGSLGLSLDDVNELNGALVGDIADVIDRAAGKARTSPVQRSYDPGEARLSASATSLSTYIVTTHSINRAVILGPNGSRMVSHGKPVVIAGETWTPAITPAGIDFVNGATLASDDKKKAKIVTIAFDGGLNANQTLLTDNSKINYDDDPINDADTADVVTAPEAQTQPTPPPSNNAPSEPVPAPGERMGSTGLPDIFATEATVEAETTP